MNIRKVILKIRQWVENLQIQKLQKIQKFDTCKVSDGRTDIKGLPIVQHSYNLF